MTERRYPNEELVRSLGRNGYFGREIKVLECGCGIGANLGMLVAEGFDVGGIDIDHKALAQARTRCPNVSFMDMRALKFPQCFDLVIDVFASYRLDRHDFQVFLGEVARVQNPGGRFFSYTPSVGSEAFTAPGGAEYVDATTLKKIVRPGSPYLGDGPFRFASPSDYEHPELKRTYCETVSRTYRDGEEYFEFLVVELTK
jgi:ubiquinone/menaquinone biosynthesis C-methylase UbiE